jgi:hypothetical protein
MNNINTIAVAMRAAGAGRALGSVFAARPVHAATSAAAAQHKRSTADATATFVDRGPI